MLYAIIKHLSVSPLKVSFEGFPPLSATLASGVKYNTLPCRVSPAPAPRSILVKKVTFQRREGESSSGSSGGSLGASQSGYLDMASLREDIAGTIVREPPPYPRQESDRFSALDP